jgi:hypothetical protein
MLKEIGNRIPEHGARGWMIALLDCVGFPSSIGFRRESGEGKPKPSWKQFDDTHHWDSAAEDWIPNDQT